MTEEESPIVTPKTSAFQTGCDPARQTTAREEDAGRDMFFYPFFNLEKSIPREGPVFIVPVHVQSRKSGEESPVFFLERAQK